MMKKNISYIPMDSALEIWLLEKLLRDPPDSDCAKDLLSGIQEMIRGEVSSLLLGASEESDWPVGTLSDRILAGDLEIYPRGRKVLIKGSEVNLTPKEFDILYFLVQNKGEVLQRNRFIVPYGRKIIFWITATLWLYPEVAKKIEPAPDCPTYILTIWGIGYKFNDQI